jgi:hypothetical protein
MPDQKIGKVTIKSSPQPSLTNNVSSVTVRVNDQNTQRVNTIQYGGGISAGSDNLANAAFLQANNAFYQANQAFNAANTAAESTGAFARANSAYAQANSAYAQANSSASFANGAFARANAAFEMANSDPAFANGAFTTANSAFLQANNSFNVANASFNQANNSFNVANLAYAQANIATPAFTQANNAFNVANAAFGRANNSFTQANNSFNVANASFNQANNSFNVANASFSQANTAFDSANNRVLRAGDTMTGLLKFNTPTGNTIVGPVFSNEGIDLFTDIPGGYAELNFANTNYVYVDTNQVVGETPNTKFELNESAKHFRVTVPGNTLELSQQEGLVANTNLTVTGEANVEVMLHVGTGSYTLLPDLIAQFTGNSPFYSQVNQQNLDANGSADFVVTSDIGTDSAYYTDLGKRGSNNFFGSLISPLDSYLIAQGNDASRPGSNLFIITTTSGFGDIVFAQGGDDAENETARFVYNDGFIIKRNLQANGIVDGTYNLKDYTSLVYNYANTISYNVSLVYAQANAAFDAANNAGQYAQPAYNQANNAFNVANAAFSQANNSFNVANVAYTAANNAGSFANGSFTQANNSASFANGAFDRANSSYAFANTGYTQANNAASFANGAFDRANSAYAFANTGYAQANSAASFANGAFTTANSKFSSSGGTISGDVAVTGNLSVSGTVTSVNTQILLVRDNIVTLDSTVPTNVPAPAIDSGIEINRGLYQNTQLVWSEVAGAWRMSDGNTFASIASANLVQAAFGQSNNAFNVANAAFSQSNNAFNVTNVVFSYANSAYAFANTGYTQANNAASFANSAFTKANNALANTTGTFAGDLTVTGNVTTVANVTANYFVTTGSAGVITGANLIYSNTFVASVAYQFPDGSIQTTAASANISSAAFAQANNAFNVANAAFGQANNSFNVANVAYTQANNAASFANGAFTSSNSAASFANGAFTQANNAASFANSAYAFANTSYAQANNASSFANGAFTQANNAASFANSAYAFANTGYTQANNAASFANGAFSSANSAASFANGAFVTANSGASFANGAFVTGNSAFAQANNTFNVANAAFGQANNSFNVANVAYVAANNAGSFANSAYSSANVKARVWESDTPPTANNYDLWIDSSNGVSYIYTTSNNTSVWVEYGPIGTPLSNLGDFTFSSQTMTGSYADQDVIINQMGTGNIVLRSANTVAGNLIPNTAFSNIGTAANPWNKIITSNVTTQNVSISGVVKVNNSTFLATDALVSISASANSFIQRPSQQYTMMHITGKDDVPTRIIYDSFGANSYPLIAGRRARGIPESPTAVQTGDILLRLAGNGWGTTGFAPLGTARIDFVAAENYTDTARGSQIKFYNVLQGSNVVNEIASFNADSVEFTGTIQPDKGFIYTPRTISGNSTSVVIDFATDSAIRCTVNAAMTISFTNYIAGKVIDLWVTNISGTGRTITHGVAALNSTTNSLTHSIPSTSTMRLQYISFDGDLANTYVSITQG